MAQQLKVKAIAQTSLGDLLDSALAKIDRMTQDKRRARTENRILLIERIRLLEIDAPIA